MRVWLMYERAGMQACSEFDSLTNALESSEMASAERAVVTPEREPERVLAKKDGAGLFLTRAAIGGQDRMPPKLPAAAELM